MEKRQPLTVQVVIFRTGSSQGLQILVLKRSEKWDGFWQPVTGGILWGESFESAVLREVREETGITGPLRLFDLELSFTFPIPEKYQHYYEKGVSTFNEHVFGYETGASEITLSEEHTEYQWLTPEDACSIFDISEYRTAVEKLVKYLENNDH